MAKKYVLDEFNNKIEVTDEVGNTTVNEIKCCDSGTAFKMAFVTQAKYNELEAAGLLQPNTKYEITDDTTLEEINTALEQLGNTDIALGKRLDALEVHNLGAISEDPKSPTNSVLNNTTTAGVYYFKYLGVPYLMFVNYVAMPRQLQTIIYRNGLNDFGYFTRDISNGTTTITEDNLALKSYVDNKHLYKHIVNFNFTAANTDLNVTGKQSVLSINILNSSETDLTLTEVKEYLTQLGNTVLDRGTAANLVIEASGIAYVPDASTYGYGITGLQLFNMLGTDLSGNVVNYIQYDAITTHDLNSTLKYQSISFELSSIANVVDTVIQVY